MAAIATGCITLWEGASLWVFDVPAPVAEAPRTDAHSHHALQLTYALDGQFTVELPDGRALSEPAVVVAPDAPHVFMAQGIVALLFIEPESPPGRAVLARIPPGAGAAVLPEPLPAPVAARLRRAFATTPPDRDALRVTGRELVGTLGATDALPPDPRVARMIAWAEARLVDGGVDLAGAAGAAALSPSRASHLFVEHTGLAFRTWLLWRRAMQAVEHYAAGDSLTEAAHAAGFSDSAHLSRTFRRLFGLPATVLELR